MRTQQSGLGGKVPTRSGQVVTNDYGLEEDEEYYVMRPHTSARRYDLIPGQDIQQGNRTFHVHQGAPPVHSRQQHQQPPRRRQYDEEEDYPKPRRGFHPLVFVGFFIFAMVAGYIVLSAGGRAWQSQQDDWTYGKNPRTYQVDAVVGHNNDSNSNPSHFLAINLRGQILVLELPAGDASKARSYHITTVQGNEGNPPVQVAFQDVNGDGKLDMLVTIGDPGSSFTEILFNDGSQFVSKLK